MIYTGSGNVPYIQLGSVGDFIPEPRCSKSVVGVTNEKEKGGGIQEVRMAPTRRVAVGTWWSCGCKGLMSI